MYAVVGCSECEALWVVELGGESSECPRCGKRRPLAKRRKFLETEDGDHAREVRASMLAQRQGEGDAFAAVDGFADLEDDVTTPAVDDETYLESAGLDPEAVAAAGERATEGTGGSRSRREVVLAAVDALTEPTREAVVDHARDQGVAPEATRELLEKLVRAGDLTESDGTYRRL